MANLEKMTSQYVDEGYSELLAEARVCRDIVLKAISESTMNRNVTIKGGVVMQIIVGCHTNRRIKWRRNCIDHLDLRKPEIWMEKN